MQDGSEKIQNNAQQIWRETGEDRGLCFQGSEAGALRSGETDGDILQRANGTVREERIRDLAGGIVSQLVKQAERRLGNAEACITWYENERQEALAELEELRNLSVLFEQNQASTDQTESTDDE